MALHHYGGYRTIGSPHGLLGGRTTVVNNNFFGGHGGHCHGGGGMGWLGALGIVGMLGGMFIRGGYTANYGMMGMGNYGMMGGYPMMGSYSMMGMTPSYGSYFQGAGSYYNDNFNSNCDCSSRKNNSKYSQVSELEQRIQKLAAQIESNEKLNSTENSGVITNEIKHSIPKSQNPDESETFKPKKEQYDKEIASILQNFSAEQKAIAEPYLKKHIKDINDYGPEIGKRYDITAFAHENETIDDILKRFGMEDFPEDVHLDANGVITITDACSKAIQALLNDAALGITKENSTQNKTPEVKQPPVNDQTIDKKSTKNETKVTDNVEKSSDKSDDTEIPGPPDTSKDSLSIENLLNIQQERLVIQRDNTRVVTNVIPELFDKTIEFTEEQKNM